MNLRDGMNKAVILTHNLNSDRFVWLWAKYVTAINDQYHCTNCIRGPYSKSFSKHNPELARQSILTFNEVDRSKFEAIYICGVSKDGYWRKANYPHNLHAAVLPSPGRTDTFAFEEWELSVNNGLFIPIPAFEDLPARYAGRAPEFTTCRIFRWAVCCGLQLSDSQQPD
jgi:hypothetical protein